MAEKKTPERRRAERKYDVLGIHDPHITKTDETVARVRMYVGGESVDEDFPLSAAALKARAAGYLEFLHEEVRGKVEERMAELEAEAPQEE